MSKRALSPSHLTTSSLSSSSSSRSRQRRASLQLLQWLPASLLSQVCSFLSVFEVVSVLRRTCHALQSGVTADCLRQSHLHLRSDSLASLVASQSSTHALISRVPSLSIVYRVYRWEEGVQSLEKAMPLLHELTSPLDASRFLFSSLSSLQVVIEGYRGQYGHEDLWLQRAHSCLLSALQLPEVIPASFSCLRRLAIHDVAEVSARWELPFSSLARLQGLTHCCIGIRWASALSCSSLVSALSSMQSLTCLDLRQSNYYSHLLSLLCAEAATPLLLRLKSLRLPREYDNSGLTNETYNALLCRLSSLPAPPALQHFSGLLCEKPSAAGLLSIFSLPHLTTLELHGRVQHSEFIAFTSDLTSTPAPLVSLVFPYIHSEIPYGAANHAAAVREKAEAVCGAARLLARFPALRYLSCHAELTCAAGALPDSLPGVGMTGCGGSLYSLTLCPYGPSRFLSAPVSFALLTELSVDLSITDEEVELLLSGCPQLLRLQCKQLQSWNMLLIAARCCRRLLELTVGVVTGQRHARTAAFAAAQPGIIGGFLPQLLTLRLYGGQPRPQHFSSNFAILRHFLEPPHAQLQHVVLDSRGLTTAHLLSLACLPRLSYLREQRHREQGRNMAAVAEARRRTRQQLLMTGAAGDAERAAQGLTESRATGAGRVDEPPLGPHQQEEMKQRVLEHARAFSQKDNVLASVEGVDAATARAVFFAELRSVLTAAEAAESQAGVDEAEEGDDVSPCTQ